MANTIEGIPTHYHGNCSTGVIPMSTECNSISSEGATFSGGVFTAPLCKGGLINLNLQAIDPKTNGSRPINEIFKTLCDLIETTNDLNTTYTLDIMGDVITLVGSDGSIEPVTINHDHVHPEIEELQEQLDEKCEQIDQMQVQLDQLQACVNELNKPI